MKSSRRHLFGTVADLLQEPPAKRCGDQVRERKTAVAKTSRSVTAALVVVLVLTVTPAVAQFRADVVEKFAGDRWDRIPLSTEDPTVALRLCSQPHEDPCTVVAEIRLTLPQGDRAPQSLDAELAKWNGRSGQEVIEPARRTTIDGHEAIETATQGEHSIHIHKQVVHDTIVFRYGDRYAKCYGWSEPAEHAAFSRALRDFCASYDLSSLKSE